MLYRNQTKRLLLNGVFIFFSLTFSPVVFAQVYSNKEVGKKNEAVKDSIKNSTYPYSLPIWGQKATAKGYALPYSAGLSINTFWQKSALEISNLYVGFNNGPMYDLDEIVRFNSAESEALALNIRPDIWLLPFLNVYGILAVSKPNTTVSFGIWVPDTSNVWREVTSYTTKASFNATTFGLGMTPTIGIAGGWMALDMNVTWSDVDALDKPAFAFVFGPRMGKTFKFKKPEQNIAVWVGGFRLQYSNATTGSIPLSEVLPDNGNAGAKIDAGLQKVAEGQMQVDEWWDGLTDFQKQAPKNIIKHELANRTLTAAGNFLNAADGALSTISNSTIQYSLDKKVKNKWNFIVGSQFQLNKHWMLRAEYGFLGSRQQFTGGLQYRFGL
jgi:hypothetical protein